MFWTRGNAQRIATVRYETDPYALMVAGSMAIASNTFSPMAAGTDARRNGLPGYGVNRHASRTQPLQQFVGLVQPVATPKATRLGLGAGVAGQPGLPSTGDSGGVYTLAGLGLSAGQFGLGM